MIMNILKQARLQINALKKEQEAEEKKEVKKAPAKKKAKKGK